MLDDGLWEKLSAELLALLRNESGSDQPPVYPEFSDLEFSVLSAPSTMSSWIGGVSGIPVVVMGGILPISCVKRVMPLPKRVQMDGGPPLPVTDSGDVIAESGDVVESAHEESLKSKSTLSAGLTHRLSLKSSQDT